MCACVCMRALARTGAWESAWHGSCVPPVHGGWLPWRAFGIRRAAWIEDFDSEGLAATP